MHSLGEYPPHQARIKLLTHVGFTLNCDHDDHPKSTVFTQGAVLSADLNPQGEARVSGVYHDHRFTFHPGEFEVL